VNADASHCPPDIEEIAEAHCMETLYPPARLAFEDHYFACATCAFIFASTAEYIRSMSNALEQLRAEEKDSTVTRRTGTR